VSASTSGLVQFSEPAFEMPFVPGEVIAGKYEVIELLGWVGLDSSLLRTTSS